MSLNQKYYYFCLFVLIHHFNENESLDFELQNNNSGFRADVITTIV